MNRWQRPAMAAGLLWAGLVACAQQPASEAIQEWAEFYHYPITAESLAADADLDGLASIDECRLDTDPLKSDSDFDGVPDGTPDTTISRAFLPLDDANFLWADPSSPLAALGLTNVVRIDYSEPSFLQGAWVAGGAWHASPLCWRGAADGGLVVALDRAQISGEVMVELALSVADNGAGLLAAVLDANGKVLNSAPVEAVGALAGTDLAVLQITVPYDAPEAAAIALRPTGDGLWLHEALVYPATETNLTETTNAATPNGAAGSLSAVAPSATGTSANLYIRASRNSAGSTKLQATATRAAITAGGKGLTVPKLLQASASFKITRSELSGGGKRQTSTSFIMEDTIAQPSPIGWSATAGMGLRLHAGYQQAEESAPLELWNVGAEPEHFNPYIGEVSTISYILTTLALSVRVDIYDNPGGAGTLIRTLSGGVAGGLNTVPWDGRDSNGVLADPGMYRYEVTAVGYRGEVLTDIVNPINVDDDLPYIHSLTDNPDPFTPPANVTLSYTTVAAAPADSLDVDVDIYNASGANVRNWSFDNQTPNTYPVSWNGGINPDGWYRYTVNAREGGQQATEQYGVSVIKILNTVTSQSADQRLTVYADRAVNIAPAGSTPGNEWYAIQAAGNLYLQSPIYELTPAGTIFARPAVLTIPYDNIITGPIDSKLRVCRYNTGSSSWVPVARQIVDYTNRRIVAELDGLSLYGLFAFRDTIAPEVTILSPVAGEYARTGTVAISYQTADPEMSGYASGVTATRVYLDGELYTNATIALSGLVGEHVVKVEAEDAQGNVGSASVTFTVYVAVDVRIEPEVLKVNPGVLTAFVTFPAPYTEAASGITSATCDGAAYERLNAGEASDKVILKYRREDVEAALAAAGQTLDTEFLIRGTWTNAVGSFMFFGTDTISRVE